MRRLHPSFHFRFPCLGLALLVLSLPVLPRAEAALRLSSAATSTTPFTSIDFFEVGLGSFQFANQVSPSPRLDLQVKWSSPNRLHQIGFTSFVEFGPFGNMTFDPDPVVFRVPIGANGRLFFGRTHPLFESSLGKNPRATDALGAVWTQNQVDALNRRTTGWIGLGGKIPLLRADRLSLVVQYSPIFLPHFTPPLGIDEQGRLNPARFARLPPTWVDYQAGMMPIRFNIDTGPIIQVLRQDQVFVGLDHASPGIESSIMVWSAPRPEPRIATESKLGVGDSAAVPGVAALVTARPSFPRENYIGARVRLSRVIGGPEVQAAVPFNSKQEPFSQGALFSVRVQPLRAWTIGYLEALGAMRALEADYTDRLIFTELNHEFTRAWSAGTRIEHHLLPTRSGQYVSALLGYAPRALDVQFQARAGFISGEDGSYFGAWRGLDSIWLGAKSVW